MVCFKSRSGTYRNLTWVFIRMDGIIVKPKLVFFQFGYDHNVPEFQLIHKQEHVSCLSQFFDVTVINQDCDYQQICEEHEPELALFESGLEAQNIHKLSIKNVNTCHEVKKAAFLNADCCSENRTGILSDLEHWGIETCFSISVPAAENIPEIAQNLFIWPNFIDAEIYRDYSEPKIVSVFLSGSQSSRYPWRRKVYKLISEHYPSLVCPHAGYSGRSGASQMMHGERYARTINASWIAPACGSVTKEIVRKHFEIPGCKTCLVTEQSPGLAAAGFIDMENCILADENNVLDKLAYLFENPDKLDQIIEAGYRLVHINHTIKQRDQVLQWFRLNKGLKPHQKIVQLNPFEPLTIIDKTSKVENLHVISNGLHLMLLRQGDSLFHAGKYEEAERLYLKCLNYLSELPEAKLKAGLCNLYKGSPKTALSWLVQPIKNSLVRYKAIDPDPVEWAYFIICLACMGKLNDAIKRAHQFSWLRHPELELARWAIAMLEKKGNVPPLLQDHDLQHRYSIHQLPRRSLNEWIEQLCIMLTICRQPASAQIFRNYLCTENIDFQQMPGECGFKADILPSRTSPPCAFENKVTLRGFDDPQLWHKVRYKLVASILEFLGKLERKYGYFLPYQSSNMRDDEFFAAIRKLSREEDIQTALLIGVTVGEGHTEAVSAGVLESQTNPSLFCITGLGHRYGNWKRISAPLPPLNWYELSSSKPKRFAKELVKIVKEIKDYQQIESFDLILINSSGLKVQASCCGVLEKELHRSRIVLLDGTDSPFIYPYYDKVSKDPNFILVASNPSLRNGFAIFRRQFSRISSEYKGETSLFT